MSSCYWRGAGRSSTAYQGNWTNILNPTFAAYVKSQLEQASKLVTAPGARMVFLTARAPTRASSRTATPGRRTTRPAWPSTTS